MGNLYFPELWYAKAHMPTQKIFKDYFCDKMCPGWSATPFKDLHTVAIKRIAELNTKMPDEWQYVILGWQLNNEHRAPERGEGDIDQTPFKA
jgi:hypothetical protein